MKNIQTVLAGKQFARLAAVRQRMQVLQEAVGNTLTQCDIAADCQLRLDGDELHITADSAATAARIRQILPTLRRSLKTARIPVGRIRLSLRRTRIS